MSDSYKAAKVQAASQETISAWTDNSPLHTGKFVMDVSFKIDGLKYDETTGMFSMQMEMQPMTEEQWAVIAGQFGLGSIPDYLRDDLSKMVFKHRIIEELQSRITVE